MDATERKARRRDWSGLAVLALPSLLVSMDVTVLYLAVPALSADLDPSSSQLLWIADIYGFLIAGALITMGTLGDRIGRRRLLMLGAAAFGAASLLAAFSASAEMLIAARALLGVAGATLMPSTLSLIRTMFEDPRQRTVAIGVWMTSLSLGVAVGPLLGGLLLEHFWWGSVFLVNAPVMALLLVAGPRLLPEYRDPDASRLDLASAVLSLAAVLAAIYGVKQIAESGLAWSPAVSIGAGLALGALFLARQRRIANPLIDLQLFRAPSFSIALGANTLAFFVLLGTYLFFAQYLQLVLGQSPFEAGLWLLPYAAGVIVGSMLAAAVVRRVRPAVAMTAGLALAAFGFAALVGADPDSGLAAIVVGSVVMALGLAPVLTLSADMIVGSAPPERAGAAAAISETSSELGGALGVAILGSLGTAVYRNQVANTIPADVPPESTAAAKDTLGGAVDVSDTLADPLAAELLQAARDAFTQGLALVATTSAVLVLTGAAIGAVLLRRGRSRYHPNTGPNPGTIARPPPAKERPTCAS